MRGNTALLGVAASICLAQPQALGRRELTCTIHTLPPPLGLMEKARLWLKPPELALASARLARTRTCPFTPREEATVAARPLGPTAGTRAKAESWILAGSHVQVAPERPAPAT